MFKKTKKAVIGGIGGNTFAIIQPDAGTSPTADSTSDSLTLTSSDSSLTITGNALTDTIDFVANITDTPNRVAKFDNNGDLTAVSQSTVNANGYYQHDLVVEPNNGSGGFDIVRNNATIQPVVNSPNEVWHLRQNQISFNSAFSLGATSQAFRFDLNNFSHQTTGDIGSIEFTQNNFQIGNGTDPIDINGLGYAFGFGQFNANVNITGPLQGYGFQPNVNAGATLDTSAYVNAFYDNANIGCPSRGHISFTAAPNIAEILSTHNYVGVQVSPNIPVFNDNAGMVGISVGGNLGTFGENSYYNGVSVNPNITSARYASGINVTMDNVTVYPGVASSLVIQDLTIAADVPSSFADTVTIEYVDDGTAGAETVTQAGLDFTVHIESGVSTATQVAAALNGFVGFTTNLNVTISGVGSNPQVTQAATNLAGGEDPGRKQAAFLDGDVEITGSLTFGGALSIGQLNAFASLALYDTGGNPSSVHGLITNPTVAANATLTTADHIGINTAMLLNIGDNASVSTAFVGISALGLPAVVNMGSGSTVDQVSGAIFAVSLDATATGGTIDRLDLCRSVAIPNGVTAINNLRGYKFDLPFGDPGTKTHGFYEQPGVNNYFAGNLLIGGTPLSNDVVTNASVGLEIKSSTKAFVLSRMTSAQESALTAIDGMMIYNTTTNKFRGYASGSWVDLN